MRGGGEGGKLGKICATAVPVVDSIVLHRLCGTGPDPPAAESQARSGTNEKSSAMGSGGCTTGLPPPLQPVATTAIRLLCPPQGSPTPPTCELSSSGVTKHDRLPTHRDRKNSTVLASPAEQFGACNGANDVLGR